MSTKNWILTDVAEGVYVDQLSVSLGDVFESLRGCEIGKRTLRGGLCDGVDVVHVNNGALSFDLLPTRGMGLWKMWMQGEEVGWKSPVRGPVHPKFVPLAEPGGLGWLDGFDELLVRCGLESNGAPEFNEQGRLVHPLHGHIANKPAHRVTISVNRDTGEIRVTGVVEETRFHFVKLRLTTVAITRPGQNSVEIRDVVENFSGSPAELQMLYHINLGQPLLDPGSRFIAPLKIVAPRDSRAAEGIATWSEYAPELLDYSEEAYYAELLGRDDGTTRALLKCAQGDRGVSIHLNKNQLPCFTLWKNTTTSTDGYVTGLEPGTNYPNPRSFEGEQGRVVKLPPSGTAEFELTLEVHRQAEQIAQAEADIASLQGDVTTDVHSQPRPGWCVV